MKEKISLITYYTLIATAIVLFSINVYRASNMSMTHDESGTFLFFQQEDVFQYLHQKDMWKSANNHLLNTAGMQACIRLFGQSDLTVRLPNVLASLIYYFSILGLIRCLFSRWQIQLLAFSLLALNPFVNDFFCLARGYGLSVGFQLFSLYQFVLFLKKQNSLNLVLGYVGLGFASIALFTNLLFIPAFTAALWLVYFTNKEEYKQSTIEIFTIPVVAAVAMAILVYVPIYALSALDEFKWGAKSLFKTNVNLANDCLYGKNYLGRDSKDIFSVILAATVMLGAIIPLVWRKLKQNYSEFKPYVFTSLSFLFLLFGMISAYFILGSKYPDGRKSTMLIPLMAMLITFFFDSISWKYMKHLALLISAILIFHFVNTLRLSQVREWWYDRSTKDFVETVHIDAKNKDVVLASNWIFHPSSTYYIKTKQYKNIKMHSYSKKLQTQKAYDYFLATGSDYKQLKDKYDIIKKDRHGMLVLKKKE